MPCERKDMSTSNDITVFITAGGAGNPGTGVGDYTQKLAEELKKAGYSVEYIDGERLKHFSKHELESHISDYCQKHQTLPVLHLQMIQPYFDEALLGASIVPEDFGALQYADMHIPLIVTCHEYNNLTIEGSKAATATYLNTADAIIFSNLYDRDKTLELLPDIHHNAVISCVPIGSSILPDRPADTSIGDPFFFGMVRGNKGLEETFVFARNLEEEQQLEAALDFARYMADDEVTEQGRMFHIIGVPAGTAQLYRFIQEVYGVEEEEYQSLILTYWERGESRLEDSGFTSDAYPLEMQIEWQARQLLLYDLEEEVRRGERERALPVILHLGILPDAPQHILSDQEVSELLSAPGIAYLPFPQGASLRNGSLAAAVVHNKLCITTHGECSKELEESGAIIFANDPASAFLQYKSILLNSMTIDDALNNAVSSNTLQTRLQELTDKISWSAITASTVESAYLPMVQQYYQSKLSDSAEKVFHDRSISSQEAD